MSMTSKGFRPAVERRSLLCYFLGGNFVEVLAKEFPIDEGVEFRKEVVKLIDLGELVFDIEERRGTVVHKVKRKKRNLQRILYFATPSRYHRFLEVPLTESQSCMITYCPGGKMLTQKHTGPAAQARVFSLANASGSVLLTFVIE